jgi:hypothetical protein
VSRNGRKAKQFHDALKDLVRIVRGTIEAVLQPGQNCQIFCVIMLDGEVETSPGSGHYSNNLESTPEWVFLTGGDSTIRACGSNNLMDRTATA